MMATQTKEWPYTASLVPVADCFVDFGYQRPVSKAFVAHMVREWDPMLAGALIVNRRKSGKYAVLDGSRRLHAIQQVGTPDIWALVYEGLPYRKEAELFVEYNFVRGNVSPYIRHRAEVEARLPFAMALREIASNEGFEIKPSISGETAISCIMTLEDVLLVRTREAGAPGWRMVKERQNWLTMAQVDGPELLRRTLGAIREGWRERDNTWPQAKTGAMVRGIARFLAANPRVGVDALAKALIHKDPVVVQDEARQLQAPGAGSGKGRPVEVVITRLYNKHGDRALLGVEKP